ncbi:YHYH protein [Sneathiella sp.]|uniref:YHYH protein n=1 Tax=Sneathiella sp. TaxID=1964365 RepID=UPI00262A8499|nr:YHYH protein [Sneathiella sp.]MDF2367244.1 YHYH protein [Sneathiella sp.]
MRKRFLFLTLSVLLAPLVVSAHEISAPLQGEAPVVAPTAYEQLLRALMPDAHAVATFSVEGNYRIIKGDGYPGYTPGDFPNAHNPNAIRKKNYHLRVALDPKLGPARPTERTPFGIALNGVLFDPKTAAYWDNDPSTGWNYEAIGGACQLGLDTSNAHVQPNGAYHYHGLPTGLLDKYAYQSTPALIGFGADGFPIYGPYGYANADDPSSGMIKLKSGYRLKSGTRPSAPGGPYDGVFTEDWTHDAALGDLDECNGRSGVTKEYPNGTYYYVITDSFPYVPRCWRAAPDPSFFTLKGRPGAPQPAGPRAGPRPGQGGRACRGS